MTLRAFGAFTWSSGVSLRHIVHDSIYEGIQLLIDLGGVERIDAEGVSASLSRADWVTQQARNLSMEPRRAGRRGQVPDP